MIATAKQKDRPFEAILVWKLNLFARNREDSIIFKSLLRKKGIQVISMNEKFEDNATGKPWNISTISYILKNETYTGTVVWRDHKNKSQIIKTRMPMKP